MASSKGTVDQYLGELRQYQRKELRKVEMGKLGTLVVTGKLAIGIIGFIIIVLILAATFSSLASKYDVTPLGGSTYLGADVIRDAESGPGASDTWNSEGDNIEFGVDFDEMDWDWSNETNMVEVQVTFTWNTQDAVAAGSRQFSLEIYSTNDSAEPLSQVQTGWDGSITLTWIINNVPARYNASANDVDSFTQSLEVAGEGISGVATWSQDDSFSANPSVQATISSNVVKWHMENIEVVE